MAASMCKNRFHKPLVKTTNFSAQFIIFDGSFFLVENIIMKSPVWYILIMSSDLQKWKLEGCLILHGGLVSKWERSKGTGIERAGNIKAPTRAPICARGENSVTWERWWESFFFGRESWWDGETVRKKAGKGDKEKKLSQKSPVINNNGDGGDDNCVMNWCWWH